MAKKLSLEEIEQFVKDTLENPENIIKMIQRYGKDALGYIEHGQLHLDYDNRNYSSWNEDILKLFPLKRPVVITSWKGTIAAHFQDWNVTFDNIGSRAIIEQIVASYLDDDRALKMIEAYNN
jgi:hypothetical protein